MTRAYGAREILYSLSEMRIVNMRLLAARLETRARDELWRHYTANMQLSIVRMLTNGDAKIKTLAELLDGANTGNTHTDTRTARDIADDIRMKLLGGAEQ